MKTVIYLANRQVQVIVGNADKKSISVKKSLSFEAPDGSVINGMIMDIELFTSFLNETWTEYNLPRKDVILVVYSSKFIGRTIEMPALNDAKTFDYIAREYADMGREEELIFSSIHIADAEGKRKKIYAEGIEPDFIKDYVDIFGNCNIKLSAVYSGESNLITFTGKTIAKENKTFVLLVADVMTLTTILWVDGAFYYYNASRCFHEPGTLDYAADIARSLSQLTQFMKANQVESPLECIQIAGVKSDDKDLYRDAIKDLGVDTPVYILNIKTGGGSVVDPSIQKYLHAIAGLYDGGKTENFLLSFSKINKKKKTDKSADFIKTAIAIGAVLFVMIATVAVLFGVSLSKKRELLKLEAYNTSPDIMMQTMDYDNYTTRNNYLIHQYEAIKDIEENIVTYPTGSRKVLSVFDECALGYANVEYDSFDATNGIISIKVKASNVEDINKFIKKLTEKDMFSNVDYTGYRLDEGTNLWDVHVTCTLAEAAGR